MPQFVVEFGKVGRPPQPDGRLDAPAFHRNCEPIWSVLEKFLRGRTGDVLEVGSGTGQHAVEYAARTPDILWWPSDHNDAHLASIAAWRRFAGLANVRAPMRIDLADPGWGLTPVGSPPPGRLLAILCANVLHIAPWRVAEGLFAGAARHLRSDGRLFVYGPFMRNGAHTALSNAAFDARLRTQDPEWGVRDVEDVRALAESNDLALAEIVETPANNLILIFERVGRVERSETHRDPDLGE
jgi:SAM-dependent methyltransferase